MPPRNPVSAVSAFFIESSASLLLWAFPSCSEAERPGPRRQPSSFSEPGPPWPPPSFSPHFLPPTLRGLHVLFLQSGPPCNSGQKAFPQSPSPSQVPLLLALICPYIPSESLSHFITVHILRRLSNCHFPQNSINYVSSESVSPFAHLCFPGFNTMPGKVKCSVKKLIH